MKKADDILEAAKLARDFLGMIRGPGVKRVLKSIKASIEQEEKKGTRMIQYLVKTRSRYKSKYTRRIRWTRWVRAIDQAFCSLTAAEEAAKEYNDEYATSNDWVAIFRHRRMIKEVTHE